MLSVKVVTSKGSTSTTPRLPQLLVECWRIQLTKAEVQQYFKTVQDNVNEKAIKMFLSNGKVWIQPESI